MILLTYDLFVDLMALLRIRLFFSNAPQRLRQSTSPRAGLRCAIPARQSWSYVLTYDLVSLPRFDSCLDLYIKVPASRPE